MDKGNSSNGPGDKPPKTPQASGSKEADSADSEHVLNTEVPPPEPTEALVPLNPAGLIVEPSNEPQGEVEVQEVQEVEVEVLVPEVVPEVDPEVDMPVIEIPIDLRPSPGQANLRPDLIMPRDLSSGDFVNAEMGYAAPPLQHVVYPTEEEAGIGDGNVDEAILVLKPAPSVFHDDDEEEEEVLSQSSEQDVSPKESVEPLPSPENNLVKPECNSSLPEDLLLDAGEISVHDEDVESNNQTPDLSHLEEFKEAVEEDVCEPTEPVGLRADGDAEDEAKDLPIDLFCKMGLDSED